MIYKHSKGMLVDDEYIICGSANIDQCSMDGSPDTEIAIGGLPTPPHMGL
jgi:phospholipase D1/2